MKFNWKVFLISLVAEFLLSALLRFHAKPPDFLNFLLLPNYQLSAKAGMVNPLPVSQQGENQNKPAGPGVFDQIKSKLEEKKNNYQLQNESFLLNGPQVIRPAYAGEDYDLSSAYLVTDYDQGKILAGKEEDSKLPIASLTKIMSAVVALDLASPDEVFTASREASRIEPTKIGVTSGQSFTLEELLNGALLTSANDAVQVIKEGIDQKYQAEVFVKAMNAKAKFLGLSQTNFANPQGFDDPNNFSSAKDLAILTHYALENYPLISQIIAKDYQYLSANSNHKQYDLYNWNGLVGVYPGTIGVKIGNTNQAGKTTVVVSEREGKKVLAVLLGAPGVLERDLWASELLDLGFSKLGILPANITSDELTAKYSTWRYWN